MVNLALFSRLSIPQPLISAESTVKFVPKLPVTFTACKVQYCCSQDIYAGVRARVRNFAPDASRVAMTRNVIPRQSWTLDHATSQPKYRWCHARAARAPDDSEIWSRRPRNLMNLMTNLKIDRVACVSASSG